MREVDWKKVEEAMEVNRRHGAARLTRYAKKLLQLAEIRDHARYARLSIKVRERVGKERASEE